MTQSKLPEAEFVVINSPRLFLSGEAAGIDAMVFPAEMGSAWTLMYPGFTAIVPEGMDVRVPVGLVVPSGQQEFVSYLNNWLGVNVKIGMVADLHRHWVLGQELTLPPRRWSIIHDVLHWAD